MTRLSGLILMAIVIFSFDSNKHSAKPNPTKQQQQIPSGVKPSRLISAIKRNEESQQELRDLMQKLK